MLLITDLELGGTPTVVRELALRLGQRDRSLHVEVACLAPMGPVGHQLQNAGVPVTALNAASAADWRALPRFVQLVRDRNFDAVLSFLVHANVVAAVAKPACQRAVRWLQSIQTTQPYPRWHWLAQAAAQYAADAIVVPSPSVAQAAQSRSFIPREKIAIVPNAIDPVDFDVVRNLPKPRGQIGFIGRLDPIKRVPDLLSAMELLLPLLPASNDVRLHIFGDGEQRGEIEQQIERRRLTDRVVLHGLAPRAQDALAQIDLLVLPSQAEGFGLVLIEAMAAGVPVIATDAPGIRDVVRHGGNGLLVPIGAPAALARAIVRLNSDPALRDALVRRALQDVRERFSWPPILEKYLALLACS